MTYDEIVAWANEAYPQRFYQKYSEWLSDVEQDFESQHHFFPQECYALMEQSWNNRHPVSKVEPLEHFDQSESIKIRTVYRLEFRRPTEEFSPIELSREFKINKNTARRLFQELEHEGILKRISRGKYVYVH